ncbi:MAG: hypothetical protein CVV34_02805 [Methanomicrobiales archaeon HGW-Methanomicrobiales-5]|nr:MAG: hypothetical protein CVV34_02805 [Methanomicrobiales archaeon HGW-Methanomicrobiales-5]
MSSSKGALSTGCDIRNAKPGKAFLRVGHRSIIGDLHATDLKKVKGITPPVKLYPCDPLCFPKPFQLQIFTVNMSRVCPKYEKCIGGSHGYKIKKSQGLPPAPGDPVSKISPVNMSESSPIILRAPQVPS